MSRSTLIGLGLLPWFPGVFISFFLYGHSQHAYTLDSRVFASLPPERAKILLEGTLLQKGYYFGPAFLRTALLISLAAFIVGLILLMVARLRTPSVRNTFSV